MRWGWPHRELKLYANPRIADGQYRTVFSGQTDHPVAMADEDLAEFYAKWVAAQNIGRFQELLNAETEDGKYKILAQVLNTNSTFLALRPFPTLDQFHDIANVP
jgi:hypothetical protein